MNVSPDVLELLIESDKAEQRLLQLMAEAMAAKEDAEWTKPMRDVKGLIVTGETGDY